MPIYVYQVILPDGEEGQVFEIQQKMSDPPLTEHPISKMPCKRIITPPNVGTKYTEKGMNNLLSRETLEKNGMTRYEKDSDGNYYKTAGAGPSEIDPKKV